VKLLYKNIRINSLASLLIIGVGGIITYFFIVSKIKQESREHLTSEKVTVEESLKNGLLPTQLQNNIGDEIIVKEIFIYQDWILNNKEIKVILLL